MVDIIEKGWGREIIFASNNKYCGKLLVFDRAGAKGSMHFHVNKQESWYVQQGSFILNRIDPCDASVVTSVFRQGHSITNMPGYPHQLEALEDNSIIFEVSTEDLFNDSYRIQKGDSQQ